MTVSRQLSERFRRLAKEYLTWRIFLVMAVSFALLVVFMVFKQANLYHGDTVSYFIASNELAHGVLDCFRTPVYPLFLGVIYRLDASGWILNVAIAAYAVYLVSMFFLDALLRRLHAPRPVWWVGMLLYSAFPYAPFIFALVTPDGLGTALVVVWLWSLARCGERCSAGRLAFLSLMMTVLMMTRPALAGVCVAVGMIGFVALLRKRWRQLGVRLLVSLVLPGAVYMGYSAYVYSREGIFAPSVVGAFNDYLMLRRENLYFPEHLTPGQQQAVLDGRAFSIRHKSSIIWQEMFFIKERYSMAEIARYNADVRRTHPGLGFRLGLKRLWYCFCYPSFQSALYYFIALTLSGIGILMVRRRRRRWPTLEVLGAWAFTFVSGFVVVGLADSDYFRLYAMAMGPAALLLAWVLAVAYSYPEFRRIPNLQLKKEEGRGKAYRTVE